MGRVGASSPRRFPPSSCRKRSATDRDDALVLPDDDDAAVATPDPEEVRRRLQQEWREKEAARSDAPRRPPSSPVGAASFYAPASRAGASALERARHDRALADVRRVTAGATTPRGGHSSALHPREPPYREFSRQAEAFEWGDAWEAKHGSHPSSGPMRYFSREAHGVGTRTFIAATRRAFWARYSAWARDERHHYEIIRADRPCHLYYDLEYASAANPDVDGVRATDALIALTLEDLAEHEGFADPPLRREDVLVELESLEPPRARSKFSRHLVFRLPNDAAFASAAHVGHFVRRLMKKARERRKTDPRCDALFVRDERDAAKALEDPTRLSEDPGDGKNAARRKDGKENDPADPESEVDPELEVSENKKTKRAKEDVLRTKRTSRDRLASVERTRSFVDEGVYTRNRAFRLYLSSKNGKRKRLTPTLRWLETHELFERDARSDPRERVFFPDERVFVASLVADVDDHQRSGESEPTRRLISYEGVGGAGAYSGRVLRGARVDGAPSNRCGFESSSDFDHGDMPCPETARFVCRDFDAWSPPGCVGASVRAWAAYPEAGRVTLHVKGNRFCENVERAHKSNNVAFVVDFREGAYSQRCHDPECRGFRGCFRPLPAELAAEAVALFALRPTETEDRGGTEAGGSTRGVEHAERGPIEDWAPPRIESDDDEMDDALREAVDEVGVSGGKRASAEWAPPTIEDDAFWDEAAEACE